MVMIKLPGQKRWQPMDSLIPTWDAQPPTYQQLRQWTAPLVAGNRQVAPLIAYNLRPRFRPAAQLRRAGAKLRQRVKGGKAGG